MSITNYRNLNDQIAKHNAQEECRIAAELQKQGMTRTEALREAYRVVNGFSSPAIDFVRHDP